MSNIEGFYPKTTYEQADMNRFFHEDTSVMMEVQRHAALKLTGLSALLMQIYRLEVGGGVYDHSDFKGRVLDRYRKTSKAIQTLYFGTVGDVMKTAKEINKKHSRVSGEVAFEDMLESVRYDARASELTQWVWATLAYSSVEGYDRMIAPLSLLDKDEYVRQSQQSMRYLGGNLKEFPQTYSGLYAYMDEVAQSGLVQHVPFTAELEDGIFNPFPQIRPLTELLRPASDVIAGGFMHPSVRERCMDWTDRHEHSLKLLTENVGRISSILPKRLQNLPAYNSRHRI